MSKDEKTEGLDFSKEKDVAKAILMLYEHLLTVGSSDICFGQKDLVYETCFGDEYKRNDCKMKESCLKLYNLLTGRTGGKE